VVPATEADTGLRFEASLGKVHKHSISKITKAKWTGRCDSSGRVPALCVKPLVQTTVLGVGGREYK
jgi:hypothetical protein